MALSPIMLLKLRHYLKDGSRVASMGYPDMIAAPEMVNRILDGRSGLTYRSDSDKICRRHGLRFREIPDAESFFQVMGAKLDVFDIVQERGTEILCDLNKPFEIKEAYDIVLDVGTLEHCFNVGQAIFNMAGLLKKDGIIFHHNPFNLGNHGLYGFNPTFYHDFYKQNGCSVIDCRLTAGEMHYNPPATDRFKYEMKEAGCFVIAKRDEVREFVFPTQTKYLKGFK